ncbi:protein eva-1 homolog C isoform X1 [Paramormyrops kingsleyae]|uniref:protein eva-1 homolog C isoform X1 n=2 Tax=Paramormyrops kingsleyae TaxID=1676925 RepID=UPI003B96EDA9
MLFPDVTFSAVNYALVLGITCLTVFCNFTKGSAEFSGFLSKVLQNFTAQACDGDYFSVSCPPRTTISIQSSFYGRSGSAPAQCPPRSVHFPAHLAGDDAHCFVSTSSQKMLAECQDRRSCQFFVNSRLFGTDPCPSSSKYLIVWYKCRPNEYKNKVACEGEQMNLSCRRGMLIAVYSASFGRTPQGVQECPLQNQRAPAVECQSGGALAVVTSLCQRKRSCSIQASAREFGDPCYSGIHKYLSVIYSCVPKKLLQGVATEQTGNTPLHPNDLNIVGDGAPLDRAELVTSDPQPGKKNRGRKSGVFSVDETFLGNGNEIPSQTLRPGVDSTALSTEMALVSNALAAYTYLAEHPERAALYFVCGVCLGLVLTLLALVVQISCRTDCRPRVPQRRARGPPSSSDTSDSDSDWDSGSDLSARRHRRFERTLHTNVFTSAEELERAQRLEERERIIREIWMNGQPDIPGTRSLNRYY